MPRPAPHIRDAVPDDAAELLQLWVRATPAEDAATRELEEARRALAGIAANPDERLLVAEVEGHVVAALQLTRGPISPLSRDSVVHTSHLIVDPDQRRHGHAHALMDAAVSWAEEKDVAQVTAITDGDRDTNRFFARLGLVSLATVRHTTTANLRKHLSAERRRVSGGNRHLVEVLAQRRSARRRQTSA